MQSLFRPFPLPLTGRQWFYLGFLQGVGAGFIDGGVNFAIAYAMYHGQDDVRMWVFSKNTIAGDLGVTPIVQCLASMLITSTLVHTDLHHHAIAPLPFVYPHVEHLPDPRLLLHNLGRGTNQASDTDVEKTRADDDSADKQEKRGLVYYYLMLIRFVFEGTENNMMLARVPVLNWFGRLLWTAAQGAAIGIIFGFPLWCLAIVILGPIYGTGNMGNKWAPQAIKAVYGAVVGWVTNPVIATLALGSQAPSHLLVVDHESEQDSVLGVERVPTIQEDEELIVPPPIGSALHPPAAQHTPSSRSVHPRLSPLVVASTPSRIRANSAGRVPLTADVRQMSPYLVSSTTTSGPPRSPSPSASRTLSVAQSRRSSVSSIRPPGRRQSDSAIVPTSAGLQSGSATGFSYALGGTGGRAKRSKTATSKEIKDSLPPPLPTLTLPKTSLSTNLAPVVAPLNQSPTGVSTSLPSRSPLLESERAAAWDVFGQRENLSVLSPPPKRSSSGTLPPSTPKTSCQIELEMDL